MKDMSENTVQLNDSEVIVHLVIPAQPVVVGEEQLTDRLAGGCRCVVSCESE